MASATYVKFMTVEELIKMLTEIHRFSIKTKDGKTITVDERKEKATYTDGIYGDYRICWRATSFKMSAFDYEKVLLYGEGYVRYNSFYNPAGINKHDSPQGVILMERYGFTRED